MPRIIGNCSPPCQPSIPRLVLILIVRVADVRIGMYEVAYIIWNLTKEGGRDVEVEVEIGRKTEVVA